MTSRSKLSFMLCALVIAIDSGQTVRADVVVDWNQTACDVIATVGPGGPGHRLMAVTQVAVFEAVNAIDSRYASYLPRIQAPSGASIEAAVAAANRAVLLALVPAEKSHIEAAYETAVKKIAEGPSKADGIAIGERAAAQAVARAASDGASGPDNYQWQTTPGRYVPTVVPATPTWPRRTPWIMERASQFRPAAPPELTSDVWARDLQEVRALGGKNSTARTAAQTEIARFWEDTRPLVYHPVLRAVAQMPGRSVAQNARFYAAAAMAADDALIAVFDAKYTYNFWRPITALRTEHMAGGRKSEADPTWTPLITTPMHPEYPCAHCVVSGAMGAVIREELRGAPSPRLSSTSPTAPGAVHEWETIDAFMDEVAMARVYDGVHYRNSTVVGNRIGQAVGALVQRRFAQPTGS